METSLNGLGLFKSIDGFKDNLVPALVGAAGAGVAVYATDKLMKYPLPSIGSLDAKLSTLHPALPAAARVGVAVVGVPTVAMLASKFSGGKLKVPAGAMAGATAVLTLYGLVGLVNVFAPGKLPALSGFAGAALQIDAASGPFAGMSGAALAVEEPGKFGGIGGVSGAGFHAVMGAY